MSDIVASKLALHTSDHLVVIQPNMSGNRTKKCYNCKEYKDPTDFHKGATMCMTCRNKYDSSRSTRTLVNKETIEILANEISVLNSKIDFLIEKLSRVDIELSDDKVPVKKKSSKKSKSKKKSKYVSSEESSGEEIESNSEDIVHRKSKSKRK